MLNQEQAEGGEDLKDTFSFSSPPPSFLFPFLFLQRVSGIYDPRGFPPYFSSSLDLDSQDFSPFDVVDISSRNLGKRRPIEIFSFPRVDQHLALPFSSYKK